MEKYINTWKNSRENVLQQESHFLVDKEVWGPEDLPIPPIHNHIFTEIEFVAEGDCVQKVNGHTIPCKSGTIVFMLSRDVHEYLSFAKPTLLYSLCFADDMLPKEITDVLYAKNTAFTATFNSEECENVKQCFEKLLVEKENNEQYGKLLVQSIITEVLIKILRQTDNSDLKIGNAILRNALKYMRENFRHPITLIEVADFVHVTPQYFSKLFKTEINITFHEYLRNMRLDYSMMLLNTTNMSVTEICMDCGFNSSSNFTKIFKERFGVLPKDVHKK